MAIPTNMSYFNELLGEQLGGGGDSDFSTAQVTLNLTAMDDEENPVTLVAESIKSEFLFASVPYTSEIFEVVNHQVNVLMSQNYGVISAIMALDENDNMYSQINGTPTTTGGVTWNAEGNFFEVTGDGTITAVLETIF